MALNEQDYFEILRHLHDEVIENEPQIASNFIETSNYIAEEFDEPRTILINSLERLTDILSQESSDSYEVVLNNLNNYVETEDGNSIKGINVELSPTQKELYQRDYIDLSEMKSREAMISELEEIIKELRSDN